MATKTWEVKLLAGNNGIVQTNVQADEVLVGDAGVAFVRGDDKEEVAFFPMAPLLSVKDVTP